MKIGILKRLTALVVFVMLVFSMFASPVFAEGWRQSIEIGSVYNDNGFISIDLTKKEDVSLGLQFMFNIDADNRETISMIRLTESGKLAFRGNGAWIAAENENNTSYHRAEFKAGEKYNLKMNHDLAAGTIEWFLNDKKIGETTTSATKLCNQVWVMCTTENMNKLSWTVNKPEKNLAITEYEVDEEALEEEGKLFGEVTDSADSKAVQLLNALGIMGVESQTGRFWDETPVKRREIAQILCNLFKFEPTKDAVPLFNDVQEEYRGYVETVVRNGYMSGYGNGYFGANDYVTGDQLIKIFVTVLNGDDMAELSGGFPMGYIKVARQLGISVRTDRGNDEPARRIDVANMIYSALEADIMMLVSINEEYSTYTTIEGYTFLTEMLDIYRYEGILSRNEATALDDPSGAGEELVQIGDRVHMDKDGLAADYLGSSVVAYVHIPNENRTGNIVSISESDDNETIVIEKDDFVAADGFKLEYFDGDKRENITLSPGINMIYNGKAIDYDPTEFTFDTGFIKLVNNDGDGMFDVVHITSYETFVVDKVNTTTGTISARYGKNPIELEGNFYTIMRNGVPAEINKIGVGEVVLAAISKGNTEKVIKIEVCSNRVTDSVDKMLAADDGNYIEVAGVRYKIGAYCETLINGGMLPKLNAGDEAQFFTDIYNNIVYFNINTSGHKVGYLVRAALEDAVFSANLKVTIYNDSDKFEELVANDKLEINGEKTELAALSTEIKDKLTKSTLVEYSQKDGVLTSLNFAVDGYDANEFSLDDSHTKRGTYIRCSATSVLDSKYSVTASTKVFIVPKGTTDILEPSYYYINTGSYFRGNWNYNVDLYDIDSNGEVRCALIEQAPLTASSLNEGHSIIVVKELAEGVDEDGNIVPVIRGMAENGQEIVLNGIDMNQVKVNTANDASAARYIKMGDVIQYAMGSKSKLAAIKLIHDVDSDTYYAPTAVEETKSNYTVAKGFGQVIRATSSQIFVSADGLWENMTPLDTDMLVNNTGTAVYLHDSERNTLTAATFSEADRGDEVFACVNTSNKTRMMIIYK